MGGLRRSQLFSGTRRLRRVKGGAGEERGGRHVAVDVRHGRQRGHEAAAAAAAGRLRVTVGRRRVPAGERVEEGPLHGDRRPVVLA